MQLFRDPRYRVIAGCDEAGRGCLAGPVVAAAVILPPDFHHEQLDDSKKIPEPLRYELRRYIQQNALSWAVAVVPPKRIDEINILQASFEAMHLSVSQLDQTPDFLLIDGNRFKPYKRIPFQCVIKGDGTYFSIAAASILAKTYRDDMMKEMHYQYPHYAWTSNKGYGTLAHRQAIQQYGDTTYHRKSFKLLPETYQLDLFEKE